jgi:hypothetical protein
MKAGEARTPNGLFCFAALFSLATASNESPEKVCKFILLSAEEDQNEDEG